MMKTRLNSVSKSKLFRLLEAYDEAVAQRDELVRRSSEVKQYVGLSKELEELEKEIKTMSMDIAKQDGAFELEVGNVRLLVGERHSVNIEKLSSILARHDIDLYAIDGLVEVIYKVTVEKLRQFIKSGLLPEDAEESLHLSGYFVSVKKN